MGTETINLPSIKITVNGQERIAIATLDLAGTNANVFNETLVNDFKTMLEFLKRRDEKIRGLIIQSAKPSVFVAGADINEIKKITNEKNGRTLSKLGQDMLNELENLPFPTVAAINGAALGGGLELALACKWRIACDDPATQLGLPETQLGILPAWGGCVRLPRIIGIPKALDLILKGKRVSAKEAKKIGLIDEVAPKTLLLETAKNFILKDKKKDIGIFLKKVGLRLFAALILCPLAKRKIAKDGANYPALPLAIDTIWIGCLSRSLGFKMEQGAFGRLVKTAQSENLINLFFATQKIQKESIAGITPKTIECAAVCGAGAMGSGIAWLLANSKIRTRLHDVNNDALVRAESKVWEIFQESIKRKKTNRDDAYWNFQLVSPSQNIKTLAKTDIVIEAIVEKLTEKQKLINQLCQITTHDTVIASNTSTLPISKIAQTCQNPERIIGMHFFNPAEKMRLLEVIPGEKTNPQTIATALALAKRLEKIPILVKDSPGFLVNRIIGRYLTTAWILAEKGTPLDFLDKAARDWGLPMGPFQMLDLIGFDVALEVNLTLYTGFPGRFSLPTFLEKLISRGYRGKKNGKGFYTAGRIAPEIYSILDLSIRKTGGFAKEDCIKIMIEAMKDEAERCLQGEIVRTKEDIDVALVFGMGFPPFRGSILAVRQ